MCGIAGIYTPGKLVRREDLQAMNQALVHRGPDGFGLWQSGDVGLGHTRLKIIDLSERAAQPMTSASGSVRLTYNGEIYNYRTLRRQLEARGFSFRSTSDTEVLLEGYVAYGEAIIQHIEGMFAFGIWDAAREKLLLCRDRAGEKPLYYYPLPNGGVVFASEMKAILAVQRGIQRDLELIPDFLLYGYVPYPQTFYKGVRSLEPGHMVSFGTRQTGEPRRYWSPTFKGGTSKLTYHDAKDELRWRMRRIVRDRLEATDVPVGAFLSGGLDSATIVGIATRDLNRTVRSYSIGFDDPEIDESRDAQVSAHHLQSIHEEFIISPSDMPTVEELVGFYDEPFGDSSLIPTYLVSRMARRSVTVALTGDGGDEVFGGYPRFVRGAIAEQVPRRLGTVGRAAASRLGAVLPESARAPVRRAANIASALERPLERRILHWQTVFPLELLDVVLRPELRPRAEAATRFSDMVFERTREDSPVSRMLDHNFLTYLPCDLLTKVDRSAMAVALETRCPLLDSSLVDFVGGLPDEYKIHGLKTKRILRDTFADLFAPELLRRPKRGFGVPLGTWLRGPLREQMEAAVRSPKAEIYRFLDRHAVERLLFAGEEPWRLSRASQVWSLWQLETWLRRKY